jgi:hypothetical protein
MIKNDPHSGRLSTSKGDKYVEKVHEIILLNQCLRVWEVANEAGILKTSRHEILTENVEAKFVSSQTNEQKQEHL